MNLIDKMLTDNLYRTTLIIIVVLLIISFALFYVFARIVFKTKIFSKYRLIKSVALASPIIASAVAVICIFFITIIDYMQINQNKNSDLNSVIGEINIITTILSIAIAAWIGLNIYNVVEKRQIDQLTIKTKAIKLSTEKTKKANKEMDSSLKALDEQVKKDTQQLEYTKLERVRSSINLLINILINTQQDNMSSYFIREFYSLLDSNSNLKKISELDISKLICIETYFKNVYQSYEANERKEVYFFAFKGLETIKGLDNNQSELEVYLNYILFRKAELNFYLGMAQYGKTSIDSLKVAIKCYIEFTNRIQMYLPIPDNCEINIEDIESLDNSKINYPDDIIYNKEKAYICNTLGQAYNRIIRQELKGSNSIIEDSQKSIIIENYKKAYVFFNTAIFCERDSNSYKEQYIRNLGTFYELLRYIIKDYNPFSRISVKENKEKLIKIIDKASSCYSKALYYDGRKSKAHITDASAKLKKVYILSEIEDRKISNEIIEERTKSLYERKKLGDFTFGENDKEYKNNVKEAIVKYELSLVLTPIVLDSYYGLAKAYLWLALNEKDMLKTIEYLEVGEKYIVQGRMIDKDNVPLKLFEKDYHELKQEIEKER